MFKGTDKVGPEEYSKIIQRNGGRTNAFTSQDNTTYFATLASDRVGVVIDLEADRMTHLKLTDQLFLPERDVIMEERRTAPRQQPGGGAVRTAHLDRLRGAPLRVPYHRLDVRHRAGDARGGAGPLSHLLRAQQRVCRRRRRLRQCPAGGADRGGLRTDPARRATARRARHRAGAERRAARRGEAPCATAVRRYGASRAQPAQPRRAAARRVVRPSSRAATAPACTTSWSTASAWRATRAPSYDYTSLDPGLFTVYAQPLPGKTAAQARGGAGARDRAPAPRAADSARELEKAKNGIEAGFVFAQDSLFYQGMLLGEYEVAGDWRRIDDYLPGLRAVTADDVLRVAALLSATRESHHRRADSRPPVPAAERRRSASAGTIN